MISTDRQNHPSTEVPLAEKRVSLHSVSWAAYEQILEALGDQRSAQLTYYRGTLEIMTPLEEHENSSSMIDSFVNILTEEANLNLKSLQSTTLNRAEFSVGAEPDRCYYIANEPLVRGKRVNLAVDPAPDLIVEVDITHTDINKTALCAQMGVPEFWRYDGQVLRIYQLQQGSYQEVPTSPTFPEIRNEDLYQFLQDCAEQGETQAKRSLRQRLKPLQP